MNNKVTNSEELLALVDRLRWNSAPNLRDQLVEQLYAEAARISRRAASHSGPRTRRRWEQTLEWILTSRWTGIPAMLLVLAAVLWITIAGANYPSAMLAGLLVDNGHAFLRQWTTEAGLPNWLIGLTIDGMYLTTAWVISVMLPPMAIFFPLFTILEDFGYLPRVAFNLDDLFRRVGAHGKQCLTMCMGFGCNAAGVIATRIIDSPRERLIAIITNNFSLCNGRWPTQILLATIFLGTLATPAVAGFVAASAVLGVTLLGVLLTFLTSWMLSRTVLKGEASSFSLELPPYRPPRILQTLYTSFIDRTIFVLWRAIVFALPAGVLIWGFANIHWGDVSLAEHLITTFDPLAWWLGLNGVIILAYIIAIPANEIVVPTILMLTVLVTGATGVGEQGPGVMFETTDQPLRALLHEGGWTTLTALNVMLFSLCHNPCSTTIYTIWKETKSVKWTTLATLLPVALGVLICAGTALAWRFFG